MRAVALYSSATHWNKTSAQCVWISALEGGGEVQLRFFFGNREVIFFLEEHQHVVIDP